MNEESPDSIDTMSDAELRREEVRLQRAKVALEREKTRPKSRANRVASGFWPALGVAAGAMIPLLVAILTGYVTLRQATVQSDAEVRQKFAELALTNSRGPSDVELRLRVLGAIEPSFAPDIARAFTNANGAIFSSDNAAKLYLFEAAAAKAQCPQQMTALWASLFGASVPARGWEESVKFTQECPSPPGAPINTASPAPAASVQP